MPRLQSKTEKGKRSPDVGSDHKDLLLAEPEFVGPATFNKKENADTYYAADVNDMRLRIGDFVTLYTGGSSTPWVCVIELLLRCPETGLPSMKGRWFWSPSDVRDHQEGRGQILETSKHEKHELVASDHRDMNLLESVSEKCTILSWRNFCEVKKHVTKAGSKWGKLFFCNRMYYHKAFKYSYLNEVLFPGDPIPKGLLEEAGVAPPYQDVSSDEFEDGLGYDEPKLHLKGASRKRKRNAEQAQASNPRIYI